MSTIKPNTALALIINALQVACMIDNRPRGASEISETRQALQAAESLKQYLEDRHDSRREAMRHAAYFLNRFNSDLGIKDVEGWGQVEQAEEALDRELYQDELDRLTDPHTGMVNISVWSRDCDMCEGTSIYEIEPELEEYTGFVESMYDGAEGPMSINIISPEQAKETDTRRRDRALEAFENGRGANAYSV